MRPRSHLSLWRPHYAGVAYSAAPRPARPRQVAVAVRTAGEHEGKRCLCGVGSDGDWPGLGGLNGECGLVFQLGQPANSEGNRMGYAAMGYIVRAKPKALGLSPSPQIGIFARNQTQ